MATPPSLRLCFCVLHLKIGISPSLRLRRSCQRQSAGIVTSHPLMKYSANFLPAPFKFREFFDNHRSSCLTLSERQDNPLRAAVFCPKLPAFSWYQDVKRFLLILMISVHCHEDWYWLSCWPATFSQLKLSVDCHQINLSSTFSVPSWPSRSEESFLTTTSLPISLTLVYLLCDFRGQIWKQFVGFSFLFLGGRGRRGFFKQCVGYSGR